MTDGTIQSRDYREPVPERTGTNQDGAGESGGEVKIIRSLTECKDIGFHASSVHKVISGNLKKHKGFIFWR